MRQFLACKFNAWDRRTYTYHNDGLPVSAGDKVHVETNDGRVVVIVDSVSDKKPPFQTKPIVGKVEQ